MTTALSAAARAARDRFRGYCGRYMLRLIRLAPTPTLASPAVRGSPRSDISCRAELVCAGFGASWQWINQRSGEEIGHEEPRKSALIPEGYRALCRWKRARRQFRSGG